MPKTDPLIRLDMTGLKGAAAALAPQILEGPRKKALLTTATGSQRVAKQGAPGSTPRSIMKTVNPMMARIYSSDEHGKMNTLEVGRAKNRKGPPIKPLLDWMRGKGFAINAIQLSMSIGRRGFRGNFFMQAAKKWARTNLPNVMVTMRSAIEDESKRRFLEQRGADVPLSGTVARNQRKRFKG